MAKGECIGELVRVNDSGIVGNGLPSDDRFNLTYDTETGLEWLDITLSLERSYNEISGEFGAGGDYEGFRFGRGPEVVTLFNHAGLILDAPGTEVTQPVLDFLSLFGSAPFPFGAGGNVTGGRYDDTVDGVNSALVGSARVADVLTGPAELQVFVRVVPDNDDGPSGPLGDPLATDSFVGAWLVRSALSALDCNVDGIVNVHDADCATREALTATLETAGLLQGDADGNGQVEFADFVVLSAHFAGEGTYTQGDFNKDGFVQFSDFLILSENFGQQSAVAASVPEPTSVPLLLFGTLLLRIRQNLAGNKTERCRS